MKKTNSSLEKKNKIYKEAIQRENQNDHKHKKTHPFTEISLL